MKKTLLLLAAALPLAASAAPKNNQPPTVSFKTPASGQVLSGAVSGAACEALATDDRGVRRVEFRLDSTLLNTDTGAPWNCTLDTNKFANGTHTLSAAAYDQAGASGAAQISVEIQNTVVVPAPKAVGTFESLGLYWTPPSAPSDGTCSARFRKQGDLNWNEGLPLWYDARNNECRGSLVQLTPDTAYEIELGVPGQPSLAPLNARTWSENFPIAQTVTVSDGSQPLNITQGGTAEGYVLYTPAPETTATIDVANAHDHNITISAPYVIVRGLTLKGARIDAIHLFEGARDLVIEDNDISGWGRYSHTNVEGWQIGMNKDAGVKAYCSTGPWLERTVIQRNRIHHPRYGSNSWSDGHPQGPNAVYFFDCGGNHVFRYNEVYSEWSRYFMDAYGGAENFSTKGMPNADSDLYGNTIMHVWDDAIEAEGANRNVRIWGNYFDQTASTVATTSTSIGPVYIFRNVWNRSRHYSQVSLDQDSRLYMMKSGSASGFGDGRRYVLHNTMLQAPPPPGSTLPLGGGEGLSAPNSSQPMTNTVSRNNIWHIWKSWWNSIATLGGTGNDLDYDLFNGNIAAYPGAEANGILGTPLYAPGHGWSSESGGFYQLDPSSPGYDRGVRLPNFNDDFLGAAPDIGAHETGAPAMRFGVQ
jgi:hypothetical protein